MAFLLGSSNTFKLGARFRFPSHAQELQPTNQILFSKRQSFLFDSTSDLSPQAFAPCLRMTVTVHWGNDSDAGCTPISLGPSQVSDVDMVSLQSPRGLGSMMFHPTKIRATLHTCGNITLRL